MKLNMVEPLARRSLLPIFESGCHWQCGLEAAICLYGLLTVLLNVYTAQDGTWSPRAWVTSGIIVLAYSHDNGVLPP